MGVRHYDLYGFRIVELAAEGALLRDDRDAVDTIAAASEYHPEIIVIPMERLSDDFFRLRTGIAGQVIQKFLTYRLRLVILGDISMHLRESSALRDFVYECDSGSHVWFVTRLAELNQRLQTERGTQ
jgi:hypothetical protein